MNHPSEISTTRFALCKIIKAWKNEGQKIGFVPTMGALHAGHLSLIKLAQETADKVVVSIFVNPKQFAPHEDFDAYPRDYEGDFEKLRQAGVDLIYTPDREAMYPDGFATHFDISGPNIGLDSDHRPHFFNGVAVVVCKLFNQIKPDIAVFGEKDYQQLCVIRQMVRDLEMDIEIVGGPLIRDENGLALSSRNAYLSAEEYQIAIKLNKILKNLADAIASFRRKPESISKTAKNKWIPDQVRDDGIENEAELEQILENARQDILSAGFDSVDYLELREEETLAPITTLQNKTARLLFAGWVGKTRLLDNVKV